MLTAALTLLALLLLVALGAVCLLWRAADLEAREQTDRNTGLEVLVRHQCERIDGYRAELDCLSIAGPHVDTTTGSHDRLPIQPDIRQMLTDYCDGMWHHTQPTTHDREYPC